MRNRALVFNYVPFYKKGRCITMGLYGVFGKPNKINKQEKTVAVSRLSLL
jgi:hypothetical protein